MRFQVRSRLLTFLTPSCRKFELLTPRLRLRQVSFEDTTGIRKIKMEPVVQKTQLYVASNLPSKMLSCQYKGVNTDSMVVDTARLHSPISKTHFRQGIFARVYLELRLQQHHVETNMYSQSPLVTQHP
jgi:hypothetical protein